MSSSTPNTGPIEPTSPRPDVPSSEAPDGSSWPALFSARYLPALIVMAGGVGLYAMNLYFTASLMPTVVGDLGGQQYYAWAATGYLITAVTATMFVSRMLSVQGPSRSYVTAYLLFAAGTALSAASPSMEVFVAGRALQGFGAGLLTGLGYAVIRGVLPESLWTKGTGLVSAMFGIGTLLGPVLGGLFAEAEAWRPAFGMLAGLAVVLALVTLRALPKGRPETSQRSRVPVPSILALALMAATLSLSSTVDGIATPVMIGTGLLLFVAFIVIDSRDANGVLPRATYQRDSGLKWVYLTVAALCAGVMTENFIPLFGQQLAHMSPLLAGLLGAALSFGWVASQLFSVNATTRGARILVPMGAILLTAGLTTYGLLQVGNATVPVVALWTGALLLAGAGIGLAFPHLSVAAMSSTSDAAEGAKAAASVSTTQLIAFTLTSAIAGNLLSLGGADTVASARWLTLGIAALTCVGVVTALMVVTRRRT